MNDKLKSRRWWIVVWAILYVSTMSFVAVKFKYDAAWLSGTMAIVGGIIVSYVTVSSMKKKKEGE